LISQPRSPQDGNENKGQLPETQHLSLADLYVSNSTGTWSRLSQVLALSVRGDLKMTTGTEMLNTSNRGRRNTIDNSVIQRLMGSSDGERIQIDLTGTKTVPISVALYRIFHFHEP
jgi:hypothetical protein